MKPIAGLFLTFSLLMAFMVSPVQAQDETDDLYINSKDIEKKREKAKKEQVNPERTYYSYPQSGNGQAGSASTNQDDRFSQAGYTNKYIEAEKNEGLANNSSSNTSQPNNQNYNNTDSQSENVKWYKNSKRNLRRKAYGSQYTITSSSGYNSYNGWNTGVSVGFNSGWNNWYGWNSPYYNGWNNYGYGGYGGGYGMNYGYGGGYGFNNPYSFGNYYYSPGWFVGYNSYSGWGSGFGWGYGGGYGGYYNPYAWGAWGNPYYGWRPAVYVPVNTYSNGNNGGRAAVNYGPINDRSSPAGRNNYSQNGNSYVNPSRNNENSNIGNTRGGGVAPTGNNSNSRGGGNQYSNSVPSRDGYSNPQTPNNSTTQQSAPNQRSSDGGNRNYTVPARDRSSDTYSRPSNSWGGGNQGNSGFGGGQRGGGDFGGGNSGGSNRIGGGGSGGGGNSGGGGSNSGGGGGRVPGGR